MTRISQYLPLAELQANLPLDQVGEFGDLLRQIEPEKDHRELVTDKVFLSRLFEAYCGAELLSSRSKRRRLLNYLPSSELKKLATALGLASSGPFKKLADTISKIPWGPNKETKSILAFFGLPADFVPAEKVALSARQLLTPALPCHRPLYDYQAKIYYAGVKALEPPCSRLLIQMPTGSGKTRTAMEIVVNFINHKPKSKVLWLAHSEELCAQASESFMRVWQHLGSQQIELSRCWSEFTPVFPANEGSFTVAGFPKLRSLQKQGAQAPEADLIVIDEAHMVLAPTFAALVAWSSTINARVLGLTATPGRATAGDMENDELAKYFHREILGVETSGEGVIEYLQRRNVLSRVEREPLHTNITFHLSTEEWKALGEELDYPPSLLRRIAANNERNKIIIEKLYELSSQKCQILVFAGSVEQSRLLCAALSYRGVRAAHLDGKTSTETRRAFIKKYCDGEINVLCNYGVLATGFDAPKTDVVFIARPTKSIVLYSQMIGRGMRGEAVGGTAYFKLVDVIDNVVDYSSDLDVVYDYFGEYWK